MAGIYDRLRFFYWRGSYSLYFGPYFAIIHLTLLSLLAAVGLIPAWLLVLLLFLASTLPHFCEIVFPSIGQPAHARLLSRPDTSQQSLHHSVEEGSETESSEKDSHRYEVIIVGGGAAGLAVGAELSMKGISYVVLEREEEVGGAWLSRYDRLHLHTCKFISSLPYLPFPACFPAYPSRIQVAQYLRAYRHMLGLHVQCNKEVVSITNLNKSSLTSSSSASSTQKEKITKRDRWAVQVQNGGVYHARHLVLCLGEAAVPHVPQFKGEETFPGPILHSSRYGNGRLWNKKEVRGKGSACRLTLLLYTHSLLPPHHTSPTL